MKLSTKLIVEQTMFNFLMYAIVLVGGLTSILVNMIAKLWRPEAHEYVSYIAAGTLSGGALCHYLLHQNASYLALKGDDDIKKYEADRKNHNNNSAFVLTANLSFLLIIASATFNSVKYLYQNGGDWIVGLLWFLFSVVLFGLAPTMAAMGWRRS